MLHLANAELTVDLLDPTDPAEHARQGARYCWGGYIWQVRDARLGPLLAGPQWPAPDPTPYNGQGLPESFRHSDFHTQRPLRLRDGRGWIVGDRAYYIDLPNDSALKPTVRTRQGRQQLTVPISGGKVDRTLTYSLVW